MFHSAPFSTNQWAFRDQEYELEPAPGTFRAVVVGPSFVMGSGVANDEVFEALLEERLNEQFSGQVFDRYEILNFGVAGLSALQELYLFEQDALDFKPQALIYISHQLEKTILVERLANRIKIGSEIPYPYLEDVARRAGVEAGMSQEEIEAGLQPYSDELLEWTYRQFVLLCEEHGVLPVLVYIQALEVPANEKDRDDIFGPAAEAGFVLIDLSRVYSGQDISEIVVAPWDLHPNAAGHALIAQAIFKGLAADPLAAAAFGLSP